jgi:drug/metabolite transporter (DMT)-like permease
MPTTAIICGILLMLIGFSGYTIGSADGHASPTALIPAVFGLILAILGFIAKSRENLRKHLMHAAVVIGLLGFLMTAGRLLMNLSKLAFNPATIAQISMSVICLIFVILCIKSFVDARRSSTSA